MRGVRIPQGAVVSTSLPNAFMANLLLNLVPVKTLGFVR